jgi:hypothetical protein
MYATVAHKTFTGSTTLDHLIALIIVVIQQKQSVALLSTKGQRSLILRHELRYRVGQSDVTLFAAAVSADLQQFCSGHDL